MEKLKEIKVSNIIFYLINFFKIHLKGLIIWLLIALFIGLCFEFQTLRGLKQDTKIF